MDKTRRAYRAMAVLFFLGTATVAGVFVWALAERRQFRSGLLMYGTFTGVAAVGLWMVRSWGRAVALVVALGNAGLGSLVLLSTLVTRQGSKLIPAILLGTNVVLGYLLGLSVFSLPDER